MSKNNGSEPVQDPVDTETEFDRFADLAAKLLAAPKAEVNKKAKSRKAARGTSSP